MSDRHRDYKIVNLVDVNQLLSFTKREYNELEEQIKEEKRVEKELKEFIKEVEKHSRHKIHYIGHEKRYGKHLIRFLMKKGGFLEVMVEKPLVINGHFISKEAAERFAEGLKKALHKHLPDSPLRHMIINGVKVEDGNKEESITFDKWNIMHHLVVRKTVVVSIVAIVLFLLFEIVQEFFEYVTLEFIKIPSIVVSIIAAIVIAFIFEPLKEAIDRFVEEVFEV